MGKIPTAEETFKNVFEKNECFIDYDISGLKTIEEAMIEFTKLHVEAALKVKGKAMQEVSNEDSSFSIDELDAFTKNCYPLSNIK